MSGLGNGLKMIMQARKDKAFKKIMGGLESYVMCEVEEWDKEEFGMVYDLLSKVDKEVQGYDKL